jgi:hypothetical protein
MGVVEHTVEAPGELLEVGQGVAHAVLMPREVLMDVGELNVVSTTGNAQDLSSEVGHTFAEVDRDLNMVNFTTSVAKTLITMVGDTTNSPGNTALITSIVSTVVSEEETEVMVEVVEGDITGGTEMKGKLSDLLGII